MGIAADFLSLLDALAGHAALPAVRSLHVAPGGDACLGSNFGALLLEDGTVGLTYTALNDARAALLDTAVVGDLHGRAPLAVARLYAGTEAWQRALGMAAINAVSQYLLRRSGVALPTSHATFDHLALGADDRLGMVGFFPPLVAQARERRVALTVLELDPRWLAHADGFEVTLDPARLNRCNKIVCTGTVLINHTIDALAPYFQSSESVLLVGPTLGCLPDPLFARGVTAVGGVNVTDSSAFVRKWSAGEKWRGTTRRYVIERDNWPGAFALLGEAAV